MRKELVDQLSELAVTLCLLGLVVFLYLEVAGPSADQMAALIIGGVLTRWVHKGAQVQAERQAERLQEAVVAASTGNGTTKVEQMDVETDEMTVKQK